MAKKLLSDETIIEIHAFLKLGVSFRDIQANLLKKNIHVSLGQISNLKNNRRSSCEKVLHPKKAGRKSSLSERKTEALKELIATDNPATQSEIGRRLSVSQQVISYNIKKLGFRRLKKCRVHHLSPAAVTKRYQRSWPLYHKLKCENWTKFITCDEAMFYPKSCAEKSTHQYASEEQRHKDLAPLDSVKMKKGIMVWMAISSKGISKPYFIDQGAKINANYYISKVLRPFFSKYAEKWYPNKIFTFHHDSAPSHTAKATQKWLKDNNIAYIKPSEWSPFSPDAAPLDFFFWGYLKSKVYKHETSTIEALKKAIYTEAKKIPQNFVNRALKEWPRRLRLIYYCKGQNIEHRL